MSGSGRAVERSGSAVERSRSRSAARRVGGGLAPAQVGPPLGGRHRYELRFSDRLGHTGGNGAVRVGIASDMPGSHGGGRESEGKKYERLCKDHGGTLRSGGGSESSG